MRVRAVNARGRSGASLVRGARGAHTDAMHQDSIWVMIGYPAIFCTPWVLAVIWLVKRTPGGDGTPPPSMGERLRSRMHVG